MKGSIAAFPFPKNSNLRIIMNYRGINLTPIAAKVYNTLLFNSIQPKIKKILGKIRISFKEITLPFHRF